MHALLASMGTDGDLFPFIGLGIRLRARGHRVTLAANEHFQTLASDCGLEFRTLVSKAETDRLMTNRDLWHPVRSALVGARWAQRGLAEQYKVVHEAAQQPETVVVGYPAVFAARVVQEKLGCPLVSLVPFPWFLLSNYAPPALPAAVRFPALQSARTTRRMWRLAEAATDILLGRQLNRLRRSLGLKSVRQLYRWSSSTSMTIGLFPDWYAAPQPDWPRNTQLAGFSNYEGAKSNVLSAEISEFCRSGTPPVVFTFGTGMLHGKELFRASLECCQALNLHGIFLSKCLTQLPEVLPKRVRHFPYAPFSQLFPECAAVVHHGGAGTTAQALAAGLPQLILPLAWDQPDNAFRVKELGAGDWISPRRDSRDIANALRSVLTAKRRARCRDIASRFDGTDSLDKAAEWIERHVFSCSLAPDLQRNLPSHDE